MSNDTFKPSLSLDPVNLDEPSTVIIPDPSAQPVQPVYAQPVQPVVDPNFAQPVYAQPVAQPTQPVYAQPVVDPNFAQPVQPVYAQPVAQPTQPVYAQPVVDPNFAQPTQPVYAQPVAQPTQPVYAQPVAPLTTNPNAPVAQPVPTAPVQSVTSHEESILSPEELQMVQEFSQKIDVTDSAMILQFGASTQKEVAAFSEKALSSVRTKDLGAVGDNLSALMKELKSITPEEEEKGLKAFFKKKGDALQTMRNNFATAEQNVDRISQELESHQVMLMKDIAMFDQLYDMNAKYYKELTMYILAGKKRLEEVRSTTLVELENTARTTGSPQDAQNFNDYANLCTRFEKKLHDLDLTRMVSIQMGPQTRLLQNNNTLMLEKLQSSIVNTIPLWKSQMVIAMGLEHSSQAAAAQKAVTDMTNQMLRQNADALKLNTINTAREMERSVVDIETLQHTNQQLISTLDEVMVIQREGAQQRQQAELELGKIESELKQKLLEIRDTNQ